MDTIGKVVATPFKLLGLVPKAPKLPAPTPIATRDDAAAALMRQDKLSRRRGGAADILTGSSGAEAASGGGKTLFGQ